MTQTSAPLSVNTATHFANRTENRMSYYLFTHVFIQTFIEVLLCATYCEKEQALEWLEVANKASRHHISFK